MTKDEIRNIINSKNQNIDNQTLEYFINYFFVLSNKQNIIQNMDINSLIDNALLYNKIKFYDEKDDIYKYLGPDCKGLREHKFRTIFVRKDLQQHLKEIIIYHELHHAVQTNPQNNNVGINQETNFGRLIMEAQTQYFAEEVYKAIHSVQFEEKDIPSENLRMIKGGTIKSSMHNYEMYDSILNKLSILLDVSKDFFVYINFLYENGMNLLKQRYNEMKNKYKFPYTFEDFMFRIDYIYCTDLLAYKENPDKENILKGKETNDKYIIYKNKSTNISLKKQFEVLDDIDRKYFLCLFDNNGDYISFLKYICKNETKNIINQFIQETNHQMK